MHPQFLVRSSLLVVSVIAQVACGSTTGDAGKAAGGSSGAPGSIGSAGSANAGAGPGGACEDHDAFGRVYWGELHVHTSYSLDSYSAGNRNSPEDAYAFARGAELTLNAGSGGTTKLKLDRPLDFAAVTDHSEFLSLAGLCVLQADGGRYCQNYRDQGSGAQIVQLAAALAQLTSSEPRPPGPCEGARGAEACNQGALDAWQRTQAATEAANDPCRFTAFHGYEWTATTGGANLHRNVIFSGAKVPELPLDYIRFPTPLSLWSALEEQCREEDGCRALTIPHNANSSYGMMWETASDPAAVPLMQRYQRLVEIFQHKGNSECLPNQRLSDPQCNFEIVSGSFIPDLGRDVPDEQSAAGYVRAGLARGLSLASQGGENPLMMGIISSTDTHNGTAGAVRESDFKGHFAAQDDTAERRLRGSQSSFNPGGLVGVWASENTRAAIFEALERRATFATSGPRIPLRFFAINDLSTAEEAAEVCADPEFPKLAFERGAVWMGSETTTAKKPYLFAFAMKDEANLQQIDIVRLAADSAGETSVAIKTFPLQAAEGAVSCVFFQDSAFDPNQPTLYYARVFEEPTWRWSHYDCAAVGGPDCAEGGSLNSQIRERAWSSPIFFR